MITIKVKTLDGIDRSFDVSGDLAIKAFKEHIAPSVNIPATNQRVIYRGRVLLDEKILNALDLDGKTLHIVEKAPDRPDQPAQNNVLPRPAQGNNIEHVFREISEQQIVVGSLSVPVTDLEPQALIGGVRRVLNRLGETGRRATLNVNRQPESGGLEIAVMLREYGPIEISSPAHSRLHYVENILSQIDNSITNINIVQTRQTGPNQQNRVDSEQQTNCPNSNITTINESTENSTAGTSTSTPINNIDPASNQSDLNGVEPRQENQSNQSTVRYLDADMNYYANVFERMLNLQRRLEPQYLRYLAMLRNDTNYSSTEQREIDRRFYNEMQTILHNMSHVYHSISDLNVPFASQPPRSVEPRANVNQPVVIRPPEAQITMHFMRASDFPPSTPNSAPVQLLQRPVSSTGPVGSNPMANNNTTNPPVDVSSGGNIFFTPPPPLVANRSVSDDVMRNPYLPLQSDTLASHMFFAPPPPVAPQNRPAGNPNTISMFELQQGILASAFAPQNFGSVARAPVLPPRNVIRPDWGSQRQTPDSGYRVMRTPTAVDQTIQGIGNNSIRPMRDLQPAARRMAIPFTPSLTNFGTGRGGPLFGPLPTGGINVGQSVSWPGLLGMSRQIGSNTAGVGRGVTSPQQSVQGTPPVGRQRHPAGNESLAGSNVTPQSNNNPSAQNGNAAAMPFLQRLLGQILGGVMGNNIPSTTATSTGSNATSATNNTPVNTSDANSPRQYPRTDFMNMGNQTNVGAMGPLLNDMQAQGFAIPPQGFAIPPQGFAIPPQGVQTFVVPVGVPMSATLDGLRMTLGNDPFLGCHSRHLAVNNRAATRNAASEQTRNASAQTTTRTTSSREESSNNSTRSASEDGLDLEDFEETIERVLRSVLDNMRMHRSAGATGISFRVEADFDATADQENQTGDSEQVQSTRGVDQAQNSVPASDQTLATTGNPEPAVSINQTQDDPDLLIPQLDLSASEQHHIPIDSDPPPLPQNGNHHSPDDDWKSQVPPEWIPIIEADMKKQLNEKEKEGESNFSPGYLNGMPLKRRKMHENDRKSKRMPPNHGDEITIESYLTCSEEDESFSEPGSSKDGLASSEKFIRRD